LRILFALNRFAALFAQFGLEAGCFYGRYESGHSGSLCFVGDYRALGFGADLDFPYTRHGEQCSTHCLGSSRSAQAADDERYFLEGSSRF